MACERCMRHKPGPVATWGQRRFKCPECGQGWQLCPIVHGALWETDEEIKAQEARAAQQLAVVNYP